jgi:hypothetical protein
LGRSPSFCPVRTRVTEVSEGEQVLEEEVDTTPVVQGSASTGSGITAEIVYYPGEPTYQYGAIFPAGYEVFNKPREFRTYDDAQWYVEKVASPAREGAVPDAPVEENWALVGKVKDANGKIWWAYSSGPRRKVVDPAGQTGPYEFSSWMEMNAWLWPPSSEEVQQASRTPTSIEEERRSSGEVARMGLRVY